MPGQQHQVMSRAAIKVQIAAGGAGSLGPTHPISFLKIDDHAACEVPHERQSAKYGMIHSFDGRLVQ